MGRRSRKRATSPSAPPPREEPPRAVAAAPRPAPRAASYKSRREDAPQPAWHPFPLTELAILLSIVLIALGLFTHGQTRGILLGGGFLLVTLSAGELSVREHFAGYRSHSSLLAGMCAVVVAALLWLSPVPQALILIVAVGVFGGALLGFRRAFMRRSGGVGFRA